MTILEQGVLGISMGGIVGAYRLYALRVCSRAMALVQLGKAHGVFKAALLSPRSLQLFFVFGYHKRFPCSCELSSKILGRAAAMILAELHLTSPYGSTSVSTRKWGLCCIRSSFEPNKMLCFRVLDKHVPA